MRNGWKLIAIAIFVPVLLLSTACAAPEDAATEDTGAEEWAALQAAKDKLEQTRSDLADLRMKIESGEIEEAVDAATDAAADAAAAVGEEGAEAAMSLEDRAATLEQDVLRLTDEFSTAIVTFLNNQDMVAGAELTEPQAKAINWKTHEDILLAQEYIDKGGDYRRAIDIYKQSAGLDPDNPELAAALAKAEADRFMTEERFAVVKKKMTQDEVRGLLGTVLTRNVKEFDDRDAIGWFYPKEDGGAAGVYFQEKRGEMVVYSTNFDAVSAEPEVVEGGS